MKTKWCLAVVLVVATISCQLLSTAPIPSQAPTQQLSPIPSALPPSPTAPPSAVPVLASPAPGPSAAAATTSAAQSTTEPAAAPSLPPLTIDWTKPFAGPLDTGEALSLTTWTPQPYAGKNLSLPFDVGQIANAHVLDSLTAAEKSFLAQNGFVAIHSQEGQFGDIRVETAAQTGQPYYLTADAAFHAMHLLFDDMLKSVEKEYFRPQMIAITQATLGEVQAESSKATGTAFEADEKNALAYLSVALKLFDPTATVDSSVSDVVDQQIAQIMAGGGQSPSVLFADFQDDYGAYKPVGHYAGDPDLEAYFRGMTWYGRVHFRLQDPATPGFVPSRLPLIVTLALRRAQIDGQPASDVWASLHETLTFVVGPSDDAGPVEYAALMDQVYGNHPTLQDLADDGRWKAFLAQSQQIPAPQINSLFITSTVSLASTAGWRFMGQRFTLDGMIFQNVIYDVVTAKPDGTRRELPSGLDVMAAFGSLPAQAELQKAGATSFPNYLDQMARMQQVVQARPETQWLGRFYDGWLYSFFPALQPKATAYPAYMQTPAWSYKDLNAALGSWAELKHDTVLYTKMPEMGGGGGPPTSGPAPSYVEPNPLVFYRLGYIARMLSCGLQERIMQQACTDTNYPNSTDASGYLAGMMQLGDRFNILGDAATAELAGQALTDDEEQAVTSCLGMIECLNLGSMSRQPNSVMPKVPVVAAVSGALQNVLEVGVGNVDRIYVVVPLDGKWQVAQGGVFSYYEFAQPRSQRLTDDDWRQKLAAGGVALPAWASNFVLQGGQPKVWLAFRPGDVYIVTPAGDKLNVRDQPSLQSAVVTQLKAGDYVEISDGPVVADGHTWWKFKVAAYTDNPPTGWAVESQDWYARSYQP